MVWKTESGHSRDFRQMKDNRLSSDPMYLLYHRLTLCVNPATTISCSIPAILAVTYNNRLLAFGGKARVMLDITTEASTLASLADGIITATNRLW